MTFVIPTMRLRQSEPRRTDRRGQSSMFGLLLTILVAIGIAGFWYVISSRDSGQSNQATAAQPGSTLDLENNSGPEEESVDPGSNDTPEVDDVADETDTGLREPNEAERPVQSPKSVSRRSNDPNEVLELTFDDIKFEMEKGAKFERELVTPEIEELDKRKIRLRGFIRPSFRQSGLTQFIFVRDNKECCFGPGAAIYDCVLVRLKKGNKTDYTVRPVTIEGEFYLKEFQGPDKKIWAIYHMKNGRID